MEATIIKATIELILTRKIKKIFMEELSAKKPSDRFHLLTNAEMPLPLLTICLIFLSLHIRFTTFVHIVLNNAGRIFPKKRKKKSESMHSKDQLKSILDRNAYVM